jgi:sigma-E factor negative regulatory protein RseA
MNTKNMTHEKISAFADGEATDSQIDAALAALNAGDGAAREEWTLYHQIGDALRSDELAITMRPDFMQRMSARLEQEPAIVAPPRFAAPGLARRLAAPGLIAASVAAFALLGGPQMMVASQSPTMQTENGNLMLASHGASLRQPMAGQGELLRDPTIDQYLQAHQRYSPSLYSTAQYARSPAFATESDK